MPLSGDDRLYGVVSLIVVDRSNAGVECDILSSLCDRIGIQCAGFLQDIVENLNVRIVITCCRRSIVKSRYNLDPGIRDLLRSLAGDGGYIRIIRCPPNLGAELVGKAVSTATVT